MISVNISSQFIKSRLSSPSIETYKPFGDPYKFCHSRYFNVIFKTELSFTRALL